MDDSNTTLPEDLVTVSAFSLRSMHNEDNMRVCFVAARDNDHHSLSGELKMLSKLKRRDI